MKDQSKAERLDELNTLRQKVAALEAQHEQTEKKLRQQTQIIDRIHASVITTDMDGYVNSWNAGAERLFEYAAAEALGQHISLVYPPDQHVFLEQGVIEPLKRKGKHEIQVRMRNKSGQDFDVHLALSLLKDETGQAAGMVSYALDITQRKRAQEKLQAYRDHLEQLVQERIAELERANAHLEQQIVERRQAEEQLRFQAQLLDNVRESIIATDLEGNIIYWSKGAEALYGYRAEEVMHRAITFIVEPQQATQEEQRMRQVREQGFWSGQYRQRRQDGSVFWSDTVISLVSDEQGQPYGLIGIDRDVTERVQAEEALRRERDLLHRIMETSPAGISVVNRQGEITFANSQAEQVYKLSKNKITSRTYNAPDWRITDYDGAPFPDEQLPFRRVMETGKAVYNVRHAVERPDGQRILLSISGAPLFDAQGQVERVVFTFQDITEWVHTKAALAWEAGVKAAIAELSSALISSASLEEVAFLILERAKRLTGSVYGFVGHIDPQTNYLVCPTMTKDIWASCQVPDKDIVFKEFGGLWGWVLEHREPLLTNDLTQESRSTGTPPGHIPIQRFLSAPALIQGQLVGQIALANAPRDYTERELILVKRLASLYALAIQRKRAETALQESEQKFRSVVEQSSDGIVLINEQGAIIEWNRGQEEISGLAQADVIGRPLWEVQFQIAPDELQTPATHEQLEHIVNELLQEREAPWLHQIVENQVQRPDGTRRTTQSLIFPLETEHRFMVGSITRDITANKAAEQALQKSERRFRAVSELTSDYAYALRVSPNGTFVCEWVTEAFSRITGFTLQKIKASGGWEQLVHPADRKAAQKRKSRLLANQADVRELRIVTQDGQVRWIRDHRKPVWDQHCARVVRIYGAAQDITARKQAEATLEGLRQQHELILKAAGEGIYGLDAQGHTTFLNPAGERLLGYTADEIRRMPHHDLIHHSRPDGTPYPHAECPIYATLQDGMTHHVDDEVFWRKDGSSFAVDYTSTPIVKDDEIVGAVVTFQDITERVQTETALAKQAQELARSNAELQQFAYAASHDMQEPLRMVTSYLGLIERRYKGKLDADADDFINYAVDGVRRMSALINDLLTFSRVNTRGKAFAPTDSEMTLERALSNLKIAIEERHAVVTHDPLPVLMTDEPQLVQVFQNLISNAIKFQTKHNPPQVHVSAQRDKDNWIFAVRDNGIGIDPQHHERIFEMFQRLHTRDEYSGTGIGLAICKKIIERHGGRVWVESEPGKGSTFYFTIPNEVKSDGFDKLTTGGFDKLTTNCSS